MMMKIMFRLIYLVCLVLSFNSCCPKLSPSQVTTIHDSIVTVQHHDSIIKIPGDSSWLKALIECQNGKPVLANVSEYSEINKNLSPTKSAINYKIVNNSLQVDCVCDSAKISIAWNSRNIKVTTNKTTIQTLTVNKLTYFQRVFIHLGYLFILLIFAGTIIILYHFKIIKL